MSRTLLALGLLAAGAPLIGAAQASDATDPHQRVREIIVPPPHADVIAPKVAATSPAEAESTDAHDRMRNLIRDERPLSASTPPAPADARIDAGADPHRRIRSIIRGRDD